MAGTRRLWGPVLAMWIAATGLGHAMWVGLSDAELRQQSVLIVEGEWLGVAPWPGRPAGAQLGRIAVAKVWQGTPAPGAEVRVLQPPAAAPVSSSDLRFRPGDRGLWFLKAAPEPEAAGIYAVDHPQRFLRDSPGNAAALKAWRERLAR